MFQPAPNNTSAERNQLFEYMAAGLPVVASDFELWKSALAIEHSGLLVDPQDPTAIGGAPAALEAAPAKAHEMGPNGAAAVRTRFNREVERTV